MADKVHVFINPARLFEWDDDVGAGLPADPTPERLLQFLCTHDVAFSFADLRRRYRAISAKDQRFHFSLQEQQLIDNLYRPLWHAKSSFMLADFVGTIALCGLVAEKVAILVHDLSTKDEAARDKFEETDQAKRVIQLKAAGLVSQDMVEWFGWIKAARKEYLHYWTAPQSRVEKDAVRAYDAAIRLVLEVVGPNFRDGALVFDPSLAEYLRSHGVIRSDIPEAGE